LKRVFLKKVFLYDFKDFVMKGTCLCFLSLHICFQIKSKIFLSSQVNIPYTHPNSNEAGNMLPLKFKSIFPLDLLILELKVRLEAKNFPLAYNPAEIIPAKETFPSPYNSALIEGLIS